MKKTIAIFKDLDFGYHHVVFCDESGKSFLDGRDSDVRLTESITVEFKEVPEAEIKEKELKRIDKAINELEGKLYKLEQEKKELLSIEHKK